MTIKYIITQINDNIIYSKYNNNGCLSLNIVDKSSLVGNIYIGRVENVVKNISSAFVEIENKIKCYYQLENNKNNIFLNTKNNKAVNIGDKLLQQTPWVGIANTNQKLMLQAASEFGLTPSSRSRIVAGSAKGKESEDEMEALLGGDS